MHRGPEIVGTWVRWPPDPFLTVVYIQFFPDHDIFVIFAYKPWCWMVVVIAVDWFLCFDRLTKDVDRSHWHRPVTDQNHPKFSRSIRCLVQIASRLMFTTSSLDQLLKVSSSPTMVSDWILKCLISESILLLLFIYLSINF